MTTFASTPSFLFPSLPSSSNPKPVNEGNMSSNNALNAFSDTVYRRVFSCLREKEQEHLLKALPKGVRTRVLMRLLSVECAIRRRPEVVCRLMDSKVAKAPIFYNRDFQWKMSKYACARDGTLFYRLPPERQDQAHYLLAFLFGKGAPGPIQVTKDLRRNSPRLAAFMDGIFEEVKQTKRGGLKGHPCEFVYDWFEKHPDLRMICTALLLRLGFMKLNQLTLVEQKVLLGKTQVIREYFQLEPFEFFHLLDLPPNLAGDLSFVAQFLSKHPEWVRYLDTDFRENPVVIKELLSTEPLINNSQALVALYKSTYHQFESGSLVHDFYSEQCPVVFRSRFVKAVELAYVANDTIRHCARTLRRRGHHLLSDECKKWANVETRERWQCKGIVPYREPSALARVAFGNCVSLVIMAMYASVVFVPPMLVNYYFGGGGSNAIGMEQRPQLGDGSNSDPLSHQEPDLNDLNRPQVQSDEIAFSVSGGFYPSRELISAFFALACMCLLVDRGLRLTFGRGAES